MDESVVINRVSNSNLDDSMADVSMADDSVDEGRDALNESSVIVAVGAADTSMAGISEASGGDVQKVLTSKESDGDVKRTGGVDMS